MLNKCFIKLNRLLIIFAFCLFCINTNTKADSDSGSMLDSNSISAVPHKELLDVLAEAEKSQNKAVFIKVFITFQNTDKLETIAYVLDEGIYPNITMQMIRSDSVLRDKRLGEHFPNTLKKYKDNGSVLYNIVRIIREFFPDPNLVPAVLEYAGDSDYYTHYMYPSPFGTGEHAYNSVFEEIEGILRKVTNGKMPGESISDRTVLPPPSPTSGEISPRESYIQKWKEQWPQVQQELLEEQRELQMQIFPVKHQQILNLLIERQNLSEEQKKHILESDKPLNKRTKSFDELREESQIHNKKTEEILSRIRKEKRNDKLETIAYAMTEGIYLDAVMSFVQFDKELQDKRLVPYIAETIENSTGEKLYTAVFIAYKIPDKSLLPSLLNHALDNDYVVLYAPLAKDIPDLSVFLKTSQALYEITDGKIGHNLIGIHFENLYKQKDSLIKRWRKTWQTDSELILTK